MISFISGVLARKGTDTIVIDCKGVGYEIYIPTNFLFSPKLIEGELIHIETYLSVREDAMELYGFESLLQKQVFLQLNKVSGISCKTAIKILSGFSTEEVIIAVKEGNIKKLTTVPGMGKKTAEKLVVEMKDKFMKVFSNVYDVKKDSKTATSSNLLDAMEGLLALGFTQTEIKNVISTLDKKIIEKDAQTIIKECLTKLGR